MNNFEQWLEHYKATHGPVLDLEKMEASVKQWQYDQTIKNVRAVSVFLPSFIKNIQAQAQAARNILSEASLNIEAKPMTKPHIHQDKINEWAADPSAVWQSDKGFGWNDCFENRPEWNPRVKYRRKPRWFDMEQEWIARGKPPVEFTSVNAGIWHECQPVWLDGIEYRFKEVSRHDALKAEWEAKGRPQTQFKDNYQWIDCHREPLFHEETDYRIKPTPHPNADVLRALAEDGSLSIQFYERDDGWSSLLGVDGSYKLRIKP
jgi:hypothetical protein